MTKSEILANRLKFVKGLQESHRAKYTHRLENTDNPDERCCIGHGCNIFQLQKIIAYKRVFYGEEKTFGVAPKELVYLLGLFNAIGKAKIGQIGNYDSLITLNDDSDLTTQEIGKLLEPMINGGANTPFISISEYED